MLKRLSKLTLRAVVLTLMFAFATSGFAHRLLSPQDTQIAQAAAELGFSLSDICGGLGGKSESNRGCDVCQLTAASDLPPAQLVLANLDFATEKHLLIRANTTPRTRVDDAAHPVRAPPFV